MGQNPKLFQKQCCRLPSTFYNTITWRSQDPEKLFLKGLEMALIHIFADWGQGLNQTPRSQLKVLPPGSR